MISSKFSDFFHYLFYWSISTTYIKKAVFYETSQLDNFLSLFLCIIISRIIRMSGNQYLDPQFFSFLQNSQSFLSTNMPGSQGHSASGYSFQYRNHFWFQLSFRV